jgi:hypothetical protein
MLWSPPVVATTPTMSCARTGMRPAAARLARGRVEAAAGRHGRAREACQQAKDLVTTTDMRFENGLINLAFGQFEQRRRQRGAASPAPKPDRGADRSRAQQTSAGY